MISKFDMYNLTQLAPFDPLLGETFQAKIGEEGTKIYMETTCAKPITYNFYIKSKNFNVYGYEKPVAEIGANSVKAISQGSHIIEFKKKNGKLERFHCTTPTVILEGTAFGTRAMGMQGNIYIESMDSDYVGIVKFDRDERNLLQKFFVNSQMKRDTFPDFFTSLITRKTQCNISQDNNWTIYKEKEDCTKFIELNGRWNNNIECDDEILWERKKSIYSELRRVDYTIPSDSTLRKDIILLKKKDYINSQKEKIKYDNLEKKSQKLRLK